MAKKEEKLTRADARVEALKRLVTTLEAMPLNSLAKDFITKEWTKTYDRFNSLRVQHSGKKQWAEFWQGLKREDLFKEYDAVEKHFKYLSIFSQSFYSALCNCWDQLLNTFSPHTTWYQD